MTATCDRCPEEAVLTWKGERRCHAHLRRVMHERDLTAHLGTVADLLDRVAAEPAAEDVGCFHPIPETDGYRAPGEASSLAEWSRDVAATIRAFLAADGEEVEGWTVMTPNP